jgi:hypothetical protein
VGAAFALLTSSVIAAPEITSPPASPPVLQVHLEDAPTIDATGQGFVDLHVRVLDADGRPYPSGTSMRALILRGDARLASGLSASTTTDVVGTLVLRVLPGTTAGPLDLRLTCGDAATDLHLTLTADARKPLVVGYATAGIGPVPGWIEAADGAPDGNTARRGAISVFGTGQVSRGTRATFAYDSTNVLEQSLDTDPFLDNPDDRPFPTYGDMSIRHDDALSTNHIFASLQNGRGSVMWGQFSAQAAPANAAGGYDVLVDGARVQGGGNVLAGSAFTARNDLAYARQVITPTGLAIASQTLAPDIVIGSDIVTLVHLDRQTGAILSQTTLARGNDYELDDATGLLRFMNILLPFDAQFNPQIIVVQYEYGGPGATSTMLGGSGTVKIGADTRVDGWYLNDAVGTGNLTVLGESLGGKTPDTQWSISHERSNGFLPIATTAYGNGGEAYRASLLTATPGLKVTLDFSGTDAGYDNPFGGYATPGLVSLHGSVAIPLSRIVQLELDYLYAKNALPASAVSAAVDNRDQRAAVRMRVTPSKRLNYHVGVQNDAANSNGVVDPVFAPTGGTDQPVVPGSFGNVFPLVGLTAYDAGEGHSIDVDAGFSWHVTQHAAIGASRLQPLGSTTDPFAPATTQAEFDLDTGSNGTFFIRQLRQDASAQAVAASQVGQTYAGTAQSSTSVGFEQRVGPTTYQTGYAVEHTASGTDLYEAIGVRTKIITSARLNADGFVQVGDSLYSSDATPTATPYFLVAGTSLDYSIESFHTTGHVQERTGYDSGSTFQLGTTGPISPAVSLFGSYTGSYTENIFDTEGHGGLAYRPSRNDRYVTLLSYDIYRSNLTDYDAYLTNVAQVQELYRPSTRTELAASIAYKIMGDAYFAPRTMIYGIRADQKIGGRFDIGSEVHWSDVAPVGGYNFEGFADPDTAINPTHRGLYVTMTTYIDRIFGWGKDDR